MLEKLFKLNVKQTSVKTEVIAGITTFLAMAYILGVNPSILHDAGMDRASVFMATAISAGFASIVMGLVANYPVALAAGMGVNALFAYTICGQMGMSWQAALAGVFISGLIFIVISVTGIRKAIINAIKAAEDGDRGRYRFLYRFCWIEKCRNCGWQCIYLCDNR